MVGEGMGKKESLSHCRKLLFYLVRDRRLSYGDEAPLIIYILWAKVEPVGHFLFI